MTGIQIRCNTLPHHTMNIFGKYIILYPLLYLSHTCVHKENSQRSLDVRLGNRDQKLVSRDLCSERELADAEDGVGRGWRLGDLLQLFNFVTSSNSYFLWSTCNLSGRAFTQLSCFIPDPQLYVIDTFIPNYH